MLIVLPFCAADEALCLKSLAWQKTMHGKLDAACLVTCDRKTSNAKVIEAAKEVFAVVHEHVREPWSVPAPWPLAGNLAWQETGKHIYSNLKQAFFWMEPDCIPIKANWLKMLEDEYAQGNKPFMGCWVEAPGYAPYMAGCGVYPFNVIEFSTDAFLCQFAPWDMVLGPAIAPFTHRANHLIHHIRADASSTFASPDDLDNFPPSAVLFHKCKDGSLIDVLAKGKTWKQAVKSLFGKTVPPKSVTERRPIVLRRMSAIGDVIAATAIADRYREAGQPVLFQANPALHRMLSHHPSLELAPTIARADINLDGVYERNPERVKWSFAEMYADACNHQVNGKVPKIAPLNCTPQLLVKPVHQRRFLVRRTEPRPWIGIVPRSNSWPNRTIPDATWAHVARHTPGTKFWLGNHGAAPEGIADLNCRDIYEVMIAESCLDLVVTVDSGPAHIAAAMGTPMIVIEQASSPELHFSDQNDFIVVRPDLPCLNCQQDKCRWNPIMPPCRDVPWHQIAAAVNRQLRYLDDNSVSAVVPIYRPTAERLNKCLDALLPQVDEVVIAMDQTSVWPNGVTPNPKILLRRSRYTDSGYGRKLNFGMRHTASKWVMAVNDDVYLDAGAVNRMLHVARPDPKVGQVGMLLWYPGRQAIQHGGPHRVLGSAVPGYGHMDHLKAAPSIREPKEVDFVTGASVLIRRRAFYEVQGFDERYWLYCEDADFCLALRKAGWKVMYTPHAQAIHQEHQSTSQTPNMRERFEEGKRLFAQKWEKYFSHNANRELGTFDYK